VQFGIILVKWHLKTTWAMLFFLTKLIRMVGCQGVCGI